MSLPNQLSILRIILAPVFLFMFMADGLLWKQLALVVFVIAIFTDWYDGWHARKFGLVSRMGIFLDPLADKILTSFAFILFCLIGIMPLWMAVIIVIRDIVVTLLRSYHEYKGQTVETSYLAKVKTFIQMSYILFILLFLFIIEQYPDAGISYSLISFLHGDLNYILMILVTFITALTGILYIFNKKTIVPELENN